jgi:hypothetical protein
MITTLTRKIAGIASVACLAAVTTMSTARASIVLPTSGFTINVQGFTSSTPWDDTTETWGVFQIASISDLGGDPLFTDNLGTEYWGMFHSSLDVEPVTPGSTFSAEGLKLDIYEVNVLDTADNLFSSVYLQGESGRMGVDGYSGLTDAGSLVFSASAVGRVETFVFPSTNAPATSGVLKADLNNLFSYGDSTDLMLAFNIAGQITNPVADWDVHFTSNIDGQFTPVPEPSTYGMMGSLGLLGLAAYRRYGKRARIQPAASAA